MMRPEGKRGSGDAKTTVGVPKPRENNRERQMNFASEGR